MLDIYDEKCEVSWEWEVALWDTFARGVQFTIFDEYAWIN